MGGGLEGKEFSDGSQVSSLGSWEGGGATTELEIIEELSEHRR